MLLNFFAYFETLQNIVKVDLARIAGRCYEGVIFFLCLIFPTIYRNCFIMEFINISIHRVVKYFEVVVLRICEQIITYLITYAGEIITT